MMFSTHDGIELSDTAILRYFDTLVNSFFKVLPMREQEEPSLHTYLESFKVELSGLGNLVEPIGCDPQFLTLLAILEYLTDTPDVSVKVTRREVFRAISICNKLRAQYEEGAVVAK